MIPNNRGGGMTKEQKSRRTTSANVVSSSSYQHQQHHASTMSKSSTLPTSTSLSATRMRAISVPTRHGDHQTSRSALRSTVVTTYGDDLPWENREQEATIVRQQQSQTAFPRDDEPNLFNIPKDLSLIYRPLSIPVQLLTAAWSLCVCIATTVSRQAISSFLSAAAAAAAQQRQGASLWRLFVNVIIDSGGGADPRRIPYGKMMGVAVKTLVIFWLTTTVLQEVLGPPTRLTIEQLRQQFFLPSKLSRYESMRIGPKITIDQDAPIKDSAGVSNNQEQDALGVHFLEHRSQHEATSSEEGVSKNTPRFDAIYLNHGFGASALSWLPTIPQLSKRLSGNPVVLGHDAPGFGFTERRERCLTTFRSSQLGTSILSSRLQKNTAHEDALDAEEGDTSSVLLMGHSMGSRTTLYMALDQPPERNCTVVLVAPAFGLMPTPRKKARTRDEDDRKTRTDDVPKTFRSNVQGLFQLPLVYLLRRLVGQNGFWKRGLRAVWGNPKELSDSDVLRFAWPSLGRGWEKGLLNFAKEQMSVEYQSISDHDLMRRVLTERPNTKIFVLHGSKDPVITRGMVDRFFQNFPSIPPVITLEGCGHDPFEERVTEFCDALVGALE